MFSRFSRLLLRANDVQQTISSYDICESCASDETCYNCFIAAEMDSCSTMADVYYGRVRVFVKVDLRPYGQG